MNNYICVNNQKIELTEEQVERIVAAHGAARAELSSFAVGDTVKIGDHEMVLLEHVGAATVLIRKELLLNMQFGENSNYDGSYVDKACGEFAAEIAAVVGEDNMLLFPVDLTTDDGLKDYGQIERRAALLTAEQYRQYVEIFDKHKVDRWWCLATPESAKPHDDPNWVVCVSPSGCVSRSVCIYGIGVRPFLIFNSSIFGSSEE